MISKINITRILLVVVLLSLSLGSLACDKAKTAGRVAEAAGSELVSIIAEESEAGRLSVNDADFLKDIAGEVSSIGGRLARDPRDYSKLSASQKRDLITSFISDLSAQATRLDSQGLLRIKNPKTRERFEKITRDIKRGVSIARIVQAALQPTSN